MKVCCYTKHLVVLPLFAIIFNAHLWAQEIKRPSILGIASVEFQVSDLKKSAVFYQTVMGYEMLPVNSNNTDKHKQVNIKINQRQTVTLQDGLPTDQDERLLGLSFQTTDVEAMRLYLQSKGIKAPSTLTKNANGICFSILDPDNHPVGFIQYTTNQEVQPKQPAAISKRILHAGITIKNAQAANDFYATILGFSEIWRGGSTDTVTSWINMRVPDGTDYIEYMLVNGPVSRQQLGSLHHIALLVPDMQAAVDILMPRSIQTKYTVAAPRIGRNNRWQLNLFDPDGTRMELMEPFPMR